MRHWKSLSAIAGIVFALLMRIAPALADDEIIPLNANAYGNNYGGWSAQWWQWVFSIPAANSPFSDTTGTNCTQQQSGPVFYLAGTLGSGHVTRSCTVPARKALFFPIFNTIWGAAVGDCDPTVPGVACNLGVLRGKAAASMDPVTLKAVIDGDSVENLRQQRVQSPAFTITYPDDNFGGIPAGPYAPNISDGYWLLLPPLSAGRHTIYFRGEATDGAFKGAVIEVTYKLFVQR